MTENTIYLLQMAGLAIFAAGMFYAAFRLAYR